MSGYRVQGAGCREPGTQRQRTDDRQRMFIFVLSFFVFLTGNVFAQMDVQSAQTSTLSPSPITPAVKLSDETAPSSLTPVASPSDKTLATPLTPTPQEEIPPEEKNSAEQKKEEDKSKIPAEISAEKVTHFPDIKVTEASGKVLLHYKDVYIHADALQMDDELQLVYAYGNIVYEDPDSHFSGEAVKFDMKTNEAVIFKADGGRNPLYFKTKMLRSLPKRLDTEISTGTTCDKEKPHYHITAKKYYVIPGNRAVAKNITFYIGKTKVFHFPLYVASLKEKKRQPFEPQFGHNDFDGWFLKNTFSYGFTRDLLGNFFLDFYEKRGTGEGIEQILSLARGGELSLYFYHLANKKQKDSASILTRLSYKQPFPDSLNVSAAAEQRNEITSSGFGKFEVKTFSSNLHVDKREKYYNTTLDTNYRTYGGGTETINLQTVWQQSVQFRPSMSASLSLDFSQSDRKGLFAYTHPNQELNWRLELSQNKQAYQASLKMQRREDIDKEKFTQDNFSVTNIVPEFTLRFPFRYKRKTLPLSFTGLIGRYDETNKKIKVKYETRLDYAQAFKLTRNTTLSPAANYIQDWYNNHDAQYSAGVAPSLTIQHTRAFSTNLNYNWVESRGYTPLFSDHRGSASTAGGLFTFNWNKKYVLTLNSGYDFKSRIYQLLVAKFITKPYDPSDRFMTETTAEYDFNRSKPRNLTQSLLFKPSDDTGYKTVFYYDLEKDKGMRWDNELNAKLGKWWQMAYKNSYNPRTGKFLYNDFLFIRDLHCWEARISYRRQTFNQFFVELSLKAFPTEKVKLGVDPQGVAYEASFLNF